METQKMARQVVKFQQTMFDNAFKTVCSIQDQTEEMTKTFMDQMGWMPEDGVKAFRDSIEIYKKARESYKKAVDDGFDRMEELFNGSRA